MEPETTNANGNEVLDMADKTYSIKELADQAHVTKSAIRKLMTQTFRKQYTSVSGNRILIDDAGAKIILGHFANPGTQTTNANEREPQTKPKTLVHKPLINRTRTTIRPQTKMQTIN